MRPIRTLKRLLIGWERMVHNSDSIVQGIASTNNVHSRAFLWL